MATLKGVAAALNPKRGISANSGATKQDDVTRALMQPISGLMAVNDLQTQGSATARKPWADCFNPDGILISRLAHSSPQHLALKS
jgi:hypothetical protein